MARIIPNDELNAHRRERYASDPEYRAKRLADSARYRAEKGKKRYPEWERAYHLKTKYGITVEEYDALLEQQGGCCAICGTDDPKKKFFSVDHDHQTGKVRGLLCQPCNLGLGHVREDLDVVMSMAAYLMRSENLLANITEGVI